MDIEKNFKLRDLAPIFGKSYDDHKIVTNS